MIWTILLAYSLLVLPKSTERVFSSLFNILDGIIAVRYSPLPSMSLNALYEKEKKEERNRIV